MKYNNRCSRISGNATFFSRRSVRLRPKPGDGGAGGDGEGVRPRGEALQKRKVGRVAEHAYGGDGRRTDAGRRPLRRRKGAGVGKRGSVSEDGADLQQRTAGAVRAFGGAQRLEGRPRHIPGGELPEGPGEAHQLPARRPRAAGGAARLKRLPQRVGHRTARVHVRDGGIALPQELDAVVTPDVIRPRSAGQSIVCI